MTHRLCTAILLPAALAAILIGCEDQSPGPAGESDAQVTQDVDVAGPTTTPADAPATRAATTKPSADEGTAVAATPETLRRLTGAWRAEGVSTPMGDITLELTFRPDGPVEILAESGIPLVGTVRDKTMPYSTDDGEIVVEREDGPETIPFRFEGEQLVVTYEGQQVTLDRVRDLGPGEFPQ